MWGVLIELNLDLSIYLSIHLSIYLIYLNYLCIYVRIHIYIDPGESVDAVPPGCGNVRIKLAKAEPFQEIPTNGRCQQWYTMGAPEFARLAYNHDITIVYDTQITFKQLYLDGVISQQT